MYTASLCNIKFSGYRIEIKFDKGPLAVEQNDYLIKVVNVYIVYDLDAWPRNPGNNFKFKNCLFWTTSVVKNSDKKSMFVVANGFSATESMEASVNRNVYDFWVDYNSIDRSDILNIHKFLMTKNNIK